MNKFYYGGRGKLQSNSYRDIIEIQNKCSCTKDFADQVFMLGKIDGIEHVLQHEHKKSIDLIVELKKEIREMEEDEELYGYTINYSRGMMAGIDSVLKSNRYYLNLNTPIFAIAVFDNASILNIYRMAFWTAKFMERPVDSTETPCNSFYFTTGYEDFLSAVDNVDTTNYDHSVSIVVEAKESKLLDQPLVTTHDIEPFRMNIVKTGNSSNVHSMIKSMVKNVAFV
jgi:hypothetical protein